MIQFTFKCGGDLGIKVGNRVVAMWFLRSALNRPDEYAVYDTVTGGEGYMCLDMAEALNRMLMIAQNQEEKV